MDVVIQYAVEKLGFPISKIVIYAWSIGECSDLVVLYHTFVPEQCTCM